MDLLKRVSAGLAETNEALAGANRAWRDENRAKRESAASERERQLSEREAAVAALLLEMRRIENGRKWRKLKYVGCFLVGIVPTFFLAFQLGSASADRISEPVQAEAITQSSELETTPAPQALSNPEAVAAVPTTASSLDLTHTAEVSDPDVAADDGRYGSGREFDVGRYCLDFEKTSKMTFEQCLAAAATALTN